MLRDANWFQHIDPAVPTSSAPRTSPGCHTPNTAPGGSTNNATLPTSGTSTGGDSVAPPLLTTAASVSSASRTAKYVVHEGGSSPTNRPRPATSLSSTRKLRYPPVNSA